MIIGLSGYAQSGKDTVAELLCLNYDYMRMAFADPMRNALYRLNPYIKDNISLRDSVNEHGWETTKRIGNTRELLQRFGTEVGREMFGENFWVDQAFKQVHMYERVVFADVRFPNEAQKIKDYRGQVWRITRGDNKPINSHPSEHALDNWSFDFHLNNDGTLDDLAEEVFMKCHQLFKKKPFVPQNDVDVFKQKILAAQIPVNDNDEWERGFNDGLNWAHRILEKDKSAY